MNAQKKQKQRSPSRRDKTAGTLITQNVPVVEESATIGDVETLLINKTAIFDTIHYVYVVNNKKELLGVLSIKEIFRSNKKIPVTQFLSKKIVSAHEHTHKETIVFLALKHNLKAVPVVNKQNQFLGIIPSDTILHLLDTKAVENLLHFGGVSPHNTVDDIFHLSIGKSLYHRLPWLLLGLLGGILASGIVGQFEEILSRHLILAAFIPLIVYMADAVGTQMEAFIIRDLASNPRLTFFRYFFRQSSIVFLTAFLLSVLLFLGELLFRVNFAVSLTVSLALFFAIISSLITGLAVPFLFSRCKLDPANASGPVATIIQDLTSVFIYFSLASLLLS